jgi:DNA-binding transcriptional MerR regulator
MLYSTCAVIKESGLTARQLYYWELIGLIYPRYENFGTRRFRRYTDEDLEVLKSAKSLLDQGYTLQAVKGILKVKDQKQAAPSEKSEIGIGHTG